MRIYQIFVLCFALFTISKAIAQPVNKFSPVAASVYAQQSAQRVFAAFTPFSLKQVTRITEPNGTYYQLTPQTNIFQQILSQSAENIRLEIPINPQQNVHLLMVRKELFSQDAVIEAGDDKQKRSLPLPKGVYYQGIVEEDNLPSIATISVFENELNGVFVYQNQTYNLGKLTNETSTHCIYTTQSLSFPYQRNCLTTDENLITKNEDTALQPLSTNCVRMYYECDYQFYLSKNSNTTTVVNYVASLFNVINTLYNNESVTTSISKIFVWTNADGYGSATLNDALESFGAHTQNNFNGNLAHLLSGYTSSLGGLAWVNVLCVAYDPNLNAGPYAVSRLLGSFSTYPTFSWDAEVVTHETGHNLGSHHTHWCGWTGGALDNCYAVEGTCSPGPAPTNGGTIMSYCHLVSYGINFANGFGTQPGNIIRTRVDAVTCLSPCATTCAANLTLSTNITTTTTTKYEATGIISATNTLSSGTNVIYDAGQEIILQPGFIATSGSTFLTQLDGCGNLREMINNEDNTLNSLQISPNPTHGDFELTYTLTESAQTGIKLWDIMGKKLIDLQLPQPQVANTYTHSFSLKNLPAGIYLVSLQIDNRVVWAKIWVEN